MDFRDLIYPLDRKALQDDLGRRLDNHSAIEKLSPYGFRLARLQEAFELRAEASGRPKLSFPPKVFVSYKWDTPSSRTWVPKLVEALTDIGLQVVWDEGGSNPAASDVPDLVSKLIECTYALIVFDDQYERCSLRKIVHPKGVPSWVENELLVIIELWEKNALDIVVVRRDERVGGAFNWRLGTSPYWLREVPTLDCRAANSKETIKLAILRLLGYSGPTLSSDDKAFITEVYRQAEVLCDTGKPAEAISTLMPVWARFPFVDDLAMLLIRAHIEDGALEEAIGIADQSAKEIPVHQHPARLTILKAFILIDMSKTAEAIRTCLDARSNLRDPWTYGLHWVIGGALANEEELFGARNHLNLAAARLKIPDCLEDLTRVINRLKEWNTLGIGAKLTGNKPWPMCRACGSVYPVNMEYEKICDSCGAQVPKGLPCPFCLNTGAVPVSLLAVGDDDLVNVLCPTCKEGKLELSHDTEYICSNWTEKTNPQEGQIINVFSDHTSMITSLAAAPDGSVVLSGSTDRTVKAWDIERGRLVFTIGRHDCPVYALAVTSDGSTVVSGAYDGKLTLWDMRSRQMVRSFLAHSGVVKSLIPVPGKFQILSGSVDDTIKVWNLESGELVRSICCNSVSVEAVAIFTDGTYVVTGSYDRIVRVWHLASGKLLRSLVGHSESVKAVAINVNLMCIISGSSDGTIRIWKLETGEEIRVLHGHSGSVSSLAVNRAGTRFFSGSWDKTVKVWDFNSGKLLRTLSGHSKWVTTVVLSTDETRLISGSWDASVRVWGL